MKQKHEAEAVTKRVTNGWMEEWKEWKVVEKVAKEQHQGFQHGPTP